MLIDRPQITESSYLSNATIASGTSDPANPTTGELFFRTDLDELRAYNGSSWAAVGSNVISSHAADFTLHLTPAQNTLLDGLAPTLTAAELNYVDGVTSSIQGQLGTLTSDLSTEVGRATTAEGNLQSQITSNSGSFTTHASDLSVHLTSAQNTLLDGLNPTLDAAELNFVDGVTSSIQSQLDGKLALTGGSLTGALSGTSISGSTLAATSTLTLGGLPVATQQYVDNLVSNGVSWKSAARVATTGNITLSGLQTIDGVTVVASDRVLVRAQTTASENGIWLAASGAWTRALDADTAAELESAAVFVKQGTSGADIAWVQTADSITLGTTPLTWVQFSTAGGGVAGNGISISGTTIAVNPSARLTFTGVQLDLADSGVTPSTYGSASVVPSLVVDTKGRITSAGTGINITSANTASTAVSRDSSGNFSAGTITATLNGTASNANTLGGIAAASYMGDRGSVTLANINTATSNGFYSEDNGGFSKAVLVFNTGSSAGTMQYRHTYNGGSGELFEFRNRTDNITWAPWRAVLHSANYNSYSPTLTGTGASGTWGINITGNSATSTVANNANSLQHYPNRTDGTAYPIVWMPAADDQPAYSCAAVTITSSVGQINATKGVFTPNTTGVSTGLTCQNGDITTYRSGGTTGVIYLSNTGTHYLYWDGTNYNLATGNLVVTGNVTAFSDRRLKTDIEPILSPLEKIEQLNGITYKRIDNGAYGTGLIAQEVQAVMPNAVQKAEDGHLAVAYGNLAGLFVEAIKALNTQVAALRAEVETLKEELSNRS